MNTSIRKAYPADAQAICDIYNPFVRDTIITFEQDPVTPPDMGGRIRAISADYPWLVAEADRTVVAYAYASRWRSRAAYDRTVESTIYVRGGAVRSGVGHSLYMALLEELRRRDIHAVVGCIALPNPASVAFHEKCGFSKVAHFPEVGRKFDKWVDVGFWQISL